MRVADVANYLKSNVPYTYFANSFPVTAGDDCGKVTINGGGSPDKILSRPSLQVIIRAKSGSFAESKAWEIYNHLKLKTNFKIGATSVVLCRAEQSSPLFIGTDENGRFLYSINFQLLTEV